MTSNELQAVMAQCYGTEHYYKYQLLNLTYTDGVKTFVENAGAMWFLTDCGLFVRNAIKKNPNEEMFSVHLVVKNEKADMIFKDGNDEVCYKKHYSYTDCPEGEWVFFYSVPERLIIWNGEY